MGCFRIVIVLGRYLALITGYMASIADKRRSAYMTAFLAFKTFAYVVADMAGTAVSTAEDEFAAGVRLSAVETVDAKVVGVGEAAPVPCIGSPVFPDLVRDCGGILAQVFCYFTEGFSLIQGLFDKKAVIQCKMLMVSWYQFRHSGLLFPPPDQTT